MVKSASEERRRDPQDNTAYTFQELSEFYKGEYNKKAIRDYWENECTAVNQDHWKPVRNAGHEVNNSIEKSGICVCGEALIDFLPVSTADGADAFRGVPGGSPFNCCIAAQRLGMPVTFLGALSTDLFGEQLYNHLKKEDVNLEHAPRVDLPTTLAFVCRKPGEGEKYAFFKENAADRSLTKKHVYTALRGKRFRCIHMSLGAVTLEHAPSAEAFTALFKVGGKQGALRSFDPNLRANMISKGGKAYATKIETLLRRVDLVKTSDDDVEFMYGDADIAGVVAKWLKLGPKLVVITRGSKGAEAFVPQEDDAPPLVLRQSPPGERPNTIDIDGNSVPVADTVGAGDTFMGGLISGCLGFDDGASLLPQLVEKKSWDNASIELLRNVLAMAATCAAVNCSRAGCDPPTKAEADRARKGIQPTSQAA
jgi:fructokinase